MEQTVKYYENPKDNIAFERCIDVMSRLMLKYGPALLEKIEREKREAIIQAGVEPPADIDGFSGRMLRYYSLMMNRK